MQYKIAIRPLATIAIIEAYDWYELQREGLGLDFLNELEIFYNSLVRNPHTYSYYFNEVREVKINLYPYTVAYEIFATSIVIYSVFMAKQNPDKKRTF